MPGAPGARNLHISEERRPGRAATNGAGAEPRIVIIGAGFSGLGMAIRLKRAGIEDFVVLERATDVGGTWRANTYPGCQCDVPSHLYSFSFALNPNWSRTYAPQPEIWEYLREVTDRFGIRERIRFDTEVQESIWDEGERRWIIETSRGTIAAPILIAGPGPLTEPSYPDIPGLERFQGTVFHSADWNHEHDLEGERVAVIGTGASAIQLVPHVQRHASKLHVFQRTPPWVLPHSDRPITGFERSLYRRIPYLQRMVRRGIYWIRESVVPGLTRNQVLLKPLQLAARRHLRRQVRDPKLRERLTPDYTIGCKRILPSNTWYPAITKANVEVVTDGIAEIRERSIVTADGTEREIDTLICATGFHVTDIPAAEGIRGRDGRTLAEIWDGSPQAYLGTTIAGFPNLFMLLGPNTGLGHTSVVIMVEAQIAYVMGCLRTMAERGTETVEVKASAQERYNERLQARLADGVWSAGGCQSWYIDRNGRNATIWPEFTWRFRQRTARFDPESYEIRQAEPAEVEEREAAPV